MTTQAVFLTEKHSDPWGEWTEVWHVPPPEEGVSYVVLHDWWNEAFTERHVHGWEARP